MDKCDERHDWAHAFGGIDRCVNCDAVRATHGPLDLQRRIDFAIRELSEPAISKSAAEWVRVSVLAVLRGQVPPIVEVATRPHEPRHVAMSGICMPGCPACADQ